jgi:hypothetical protein
LSDWVWEVMALILLVECAAGGRVSWGAHSVDPPSAQA